MTHTEPIESEAVPVAEVAARIGESICVQGWVHATRPLGAITFLVLRGGRGTLQCIVEGGCALGPESVVRLWGTAREEARAPGGVELHVTRVETLVEVAEPPPVTLSKNKLKAGLPTVLEHAAVTLRHPSRRAVFRLSAAAMRGFRDHLNEAQFTEVQTPKIVASATEGGANVFEIGYFGNKAYLAQSPQFYKQTMVGVFERVFEVGPVFRAEPHATTRHLSEYVSLDVELGFIENHFCVMGVLRGVLEGIFEEMRRTCEAELTLLGVTLPQLPAEIPHIHFREVRARFGGSEPDLSPQEERELGAWALSEFGSPFVFVTGYPMSKRPFYTHAEPGAPEWSNSFDLLFHGLELVTGGQRLHRYENYVQALEAAGLPMAPFEGYLEAFRFGMPPHGGFAIGLERLLMQLVGASNIRETTLFPRDMNRLTP
jgi:nondiscriminating aspartyl-tRNA synthetase